MTARPLPRSAPSSQGVDARGILSFLDAAGSAGFDLHSLMVLRHGQVVAEGWWAPYGPGRVHLLYSLSKSFTATAIGIAQSENLLSIEDPVVGFFQEETPSDVSPSTRRMKVRHLLSMASGHAEDTWRAIGGSDQGIVRSFLSVPPDQEPGTLFCYNQGCTYTLSAMITKLTGQRLLDYLRPRLFDPLGIEEARWSQTAEGVDQGFTGLHVTTESIAKLGLLHLQGGRWEGRQIVPESFTAEAHRLQIDNSPVMKNPDWQQGYGFQFWMCRHGAYRGDGAFGQFCIVLPEADAVIACTAQVTDMQGELDLIWKHLLPAVSGASPADAATEARLLERLAALSTPVLDASADPSSRSVVFTRTGEVPVGTEGLSAIMVEPAGGRTLLTLLVDGRECRFELHPDGWTEGALAGLHPSLETVAVTGGWSGDDFSVDLVSLISPHRLQLRARAGERPIVEASWYTSPL